MVEPVFAPWEDPEAAPLISFKNVTKRFGDFVAIDDLTLDIFEREFFALLGPSGCGKTTMMRMLAGFEDPTIGSMSLSGMDISGIPPNKRAVNMMFQSYALFPHLSIWENIAFGLRRDGVSKDALSARVEEMLKLTRLEKFARRKPHQISGGQKQRVALARSLAKAPKLLLLDEPLGALDKKLRQDTQFELMDIQEKTGTTFVIVTHDQEEAFVLGDRVAVMNEGEVRQVGTPQQVYHRPEDRWVAEFVGTVSVLRGKAADGSVDTIVGPVAVDAGLRGEVDVVVRPEHLALAREGETAAATAEVEMVEFYGHDAMVFVALNGHRLQVRTGPMVDVKRGDQVGLRFVGGAVSAFPPVVSPAS